MWMCPQLVCSAVWSNDMPRLFMLNQCVTRAHHSPFCFAAFSFHQPFSVNLSLEDAQRLNISDEIKPRTRFESLSRFTRCQPYQR